MEKGCDCKTTGKVLRSLGLPADIISRRDRPGCHLVARTVTAAPSCQRRFYPVRQAGPSFGALGTLQCGANPRPRKGGWLLSLPVFGARDMHRHSPRRWQESGKTCRQRIMRSSFAMVDRQMHQTQRDPIATGGISIRHAHHTERGG